ncbi:MAG: hypothetical protein QOI38_2943 [Sphingomonadales bacterium]|jgi:hypothetical protein|nr:hypothetical protein [Sphingomonadales bacterium]
MSLIMLTAALLGMQPGEAVTGTAEFSAPESIAPAIGPYVDCLLVGVRERSQRAGPLHADGIRRLIDQQLAACRDIRARARTEAIRLLEADTSVARADRMPLIERVFRDIDHSLDPLVEQIERAERSERTAVRVTGSLVFPEAMRPAFDNYRECLNRDLVARVESPTFATSDFDGLAAATIATCRPVRARSFQAAQEALAPDPVPSPDNHATAIDTVFDGLEASFRSFVQIVRARFEASPTSGN